MEFLIPIYVCFKFTIPCRDSKQNTDVQKKLSMNNQRQRSLWGKKPHQNYEQ